LRAKLPDYAIPASFVFLDALPLNISGKVDRRALPAPDWTRVDRAAMFVAPRTSVEAELARVWANLLNVERVGIYDNFFDLGGHSLLATQLVSRIRDAFQIELALKSFFETPTIANLAIVIAQQQAAQADQDQVAQWLAELEQMPDEQIASKIN
jgi:acyl carrier protein